MSLNGYSGRQCDGDPFGERRGLGCRTKVRKWIAGQTAQFVACLQAAWLLIPQLLEITAGGCRRLSLYELTPLIIVLDHDPGRRDIE